MMKNETEGCFVRQENHSNGIEQKLVGFITE